MLNVEFLEEVYMYRVSHIIHRSLNAADTWVAKRHIKGGKKEQAMDKSNFGRGILVKMGNQELKLIGSK